MLQTDRKCCSCFLAQASPLDLWWQKYLLLPLQIFLNYDSACGMFWLGDAVYSVFYSEYPLQKEMPWIWYVWSSLLFPELWSSWRSCRRLCWESFGMFSVCWDLSLLENASFSFPQVPLMHCWYAQSHFGPHQMRMLGPLSLPFSPGPWSLMWCHSDAYKQAGPTLDQVV